MKLFKEIKEKYSHLYEKYETHFDVAIFILGFIFDYATAGDVDEAFMLGQQIFYLIVIGLILIGESHSTSKIVEKIQNTFVWKYRTFLIHFSLGSILNIYSFFFLKSAAFYNSILFFIFLIGVIVANELPAVKKAGLNLKWGLWVLSLICFFSIVCPLIIGFVGWTSFALTMCLTMTVVLSIYRFLSPNVSDLTLFKRNFVWPNAGIIGGFVFLFVMGLIPPVPLAAFNLGVFHSLEKKEGKFILSHEKPWWKFWHRGDEYFKYREGDQVVFFAQIYSPSQIKDQIFIRWMYKDLRMGWQTSDMVPINITGGRKEGFRGYAYKKNVSPGMWRVQIETTDHREIGRTYFEIVNSVETSPRIWQTESF